MPEEIVMPRLSDTMQEGTIARWLKREGDAVKTGEPLMEVETDKATMDLNSYHDGTLAKILLDDGGSAPVGQVVGLMALPGEDPQQVAAGGAAAPPGASADGAAVEQRPQPAPPAQAEAPPQPAPTRAAQPPQASQAAQAPQGAPPAQTAAPPQPAPAPGAQPAQTAQPAQAAQPSHASQVAPAPAAPVAPDTQHLDVKASPLARVMAEQSGLDLRQLAGRGSGPGGRIVRRDVEEAAQRGPAPAPAAAPAVPTAPTAPVVEQSHEDRELSRLRQLIARNLAISKPGAPHIYLTIDVEMDATLALRKQLNDLVAGDERARLSVNDLVTKAAALALRRFPDLNSHWVEAPRPTVRYFRRIDLGIAIQAEDGLLVGVIHAADTKSLTQIARESKDLYEKILAGRRAPEDITGATFTTSNLGQWGIDEFQAVINPPQAGILAIGAASPKAVVRDGQVVVRNIMRVTISTDHRIVDGVYTARYLQEFKRLLENPLSLVL